MGVGAIVLAIALFCLSGLLNYFGSNPRILWFPAIGVCLLILYVTYSYIAEQEARQLDAVSRSVLAADQRPYISVSAINFTNILIEKTGRDLDIHWDIKNSGKTPATIVVANMTGWFETDRNPLPATPMYRETPHKLTGVTIPPDGVFNATFKMIPESGGIPIPLTQAAIDLINNGTTKFYVFGYIKYRDVANTERSKGFIACYNPRNDWRRGMFSYCGEDHPGYDYGD